MAINNLVLGTASKSLGDITLFRRDGRQMARARVRVVANPRSEGQSETRNFLAPVTKFYGPLSSVLAKSWEGCNKARSHAMFLKTNIDLARRSGWWLTKGTPFYPMPYQLSRGQLSPIAYSLHYLGDFCQAWYPCAMPVGTANTIGKLSTALVNLGYLNGDVVTFVVVIKSEAGDFYPVTTQVILNTESSADVASINAQGITFALSNVGIYINPSDGDLVACAAIVARRVKGDWLRSTQYLCVDASIVNALVSAASRAAAIESYSNPESDRGGDVYIDGDGQAFNVAAMSGRALLFYGGQYNARVVSSDGQSLILLRPANSETYFYVCRESGYFLGTNAAASLTPVDWRVVLADPAAANDDNTIDYDVGGSMYQYLQSLGWGGV